MSAAAAFAVAAVAATIGVALWESQKRAAREDVWRRYARSRGGSFDEPHGAWLSRTGGAAMEIESGGVPVLVDIHIVGGGKSHMVYTRARASVVLADAPAFHVYAEDLLATLNKALGAEDVELGDPEFDGKFVVKCAAPQAVRGVWAKAVRDTMRASLSDAEASSDGRTVNVQVVGSVLDTAKLDALIAVAAGLAGQGLAQLIDIAALPSARFLAPVGPWDARSRPQLELIARDLTIKLAARGSDEGLRVSLSTQIARTLPQMAAAIDASGDVKGDVPPDLLPPRRDLARIGGAQLSIAGRALHLRFAPGRFPGPGPIEATIELFVALTRKPESAFR
jgi:hypothetical protein